MSFSAAAMAYVGLDPRRDVHFAVHPPAESIQPLADGKIDGYQAFAEEVAELPSEEIGHVILDSTTERPWSQYFCCMTAMHRDFVRNYPAATKRALRAILKATRVALEPSRGPARGRQGYATDYEYARQTLRTLPYTKWRTTIPRTACASTRSDCMGGNDQVHPQKLIAQGTDWRS